MANTDSRVIRVPDRFVEAARTNPEFREIVGSNEIDPATIVRIALLVFAGIAIRDAIIQALSSKRG